MGAIARVLLEFHVLMFTFTYHNIFKNCFKDEG